MTTQRRFFTIVGVMFGLILMLGSVAGVQFAFQQIFYRSACMDDVSSQSEPLEFSHLNITKTPPRYTCVFHHQVTGAPVTMQLENEGILPLAETGQMVCCIIPIIAIIGIAMVVGVYAARGQRTA
jgi:hypothetical protein